jgi:hypothetical protein
MNNPGKLLSCVPYVASFSGLSIMIAPLVFSNVYLSCVPYVAFCSFFFLFIIVFFDKDNFDSVSVDLDLVNFS